MLLLMQQPQPWFKYTANSILLLSQLKWENNEEGLGSQEHVIDIRKAEDADNENVCMSPFFHG